jgi:3-hydroxybutyryl-CoA dehydratase
LPDAFPTHDPGRSIDQLAVGDSASLERTFTQDDIDAFARISGDDNPAHVDAAWAEASVFRGRVAHGVLTAGLISAGSIYLSQTLKWLAPVKPGDALTATATVREIVAAKNRVILDTVVTRGDDTVLTGEALIMPPKAAK